MYRRFFSHFLDQHITIPSPDLSLPKIATTFSTPGFEKNFESLSWLHSVSPCFPMRGDQIKIIFDPGKFYETLVHKCSEAKKRIVLASLYLGTGHLENTFIQTIKNNLESNNDLKVNVLLDFTRGTRGVISSKTMLLPLLQQFESNVLLTMYHTPDLRGMTKRFAPPRWNELLGLQHMKVYIFDDYVVMSGANLSNDYFTNRQDRYIVIEDKNLADFYSDLISKVQEFSLVIQKDAGISLHKNWTHWPYEGTKEDFVRMAKQHIMEFFQNVFQQQQLKMVNQKEADTWIFPLIEMGQIGIHHDSIVTKKLLSTSMNGSRLKLATGYFNLTQEYMDTIRNDCPAHCSILMAHPNANGFQGARGPAGGIPAAYTLIAKHFYEDIVRAGQDHRVNLFEFEKKGWSYHAKGLWYYLPEAGLPCLSLIGSSNFGERSVNRDLESQVCVVTANESLQHRFQEEVDRLYRSASTAEAEITSRPIPRWVQAVVKIFRNFF